MVYLAPIILIGIIWWLHVVEMIKEQPQANNLFFYRVISISFTVMLLFVLSGSTYTFFDLLMSILVGLLSIAVTLLICLPQDKLPTWYIEKLALLNQYLKAKEKAEEPSTEQEEPKEETKKDSQEDDDQ